MEYIELLNKETQLKEKLENLTLNYNKQVADINNELEELSTIKGYFLNNQSEFAYAREYVSTWGEFNLLRNFELYMQSLKDIVLKDYKELLEYNLELQDNAYGGDYHKYTATVKKGRGINYHPDLGSIRFKEDTTTNYFNALAIELEKNPIQSLNTTELPCCAEYRNPFTQFDSSLGKILKFDIKTDKYDYTRLLKLLNFPEEIFVRDFYGRVGGAYKLVDNSYAFFVNDYGEWLSQYDNFYKK